MENARLDGKGYDKECNKKTDAKKGEIEGITSEKARKQLCANWIVYKVSKRRKNARGFYSGGDFVCVYKSYAVRVSSTAFIASNDFSCVGHSSDCLVFPEGVAFAFHPVPSGDISLEITIAVSVSSL